MPKYKVEHQYLLTCEITLDAENEDEALELVNGYDYEPSQSKIVDNEHWDSKLLGEVG